MEQSTASRGRPRSAETDERIVAATLDLLRRHGPGGVNVSSVAARSGVARTTIYRRYRDRRHLLLAAFRPVTTTGAPPEGMPVAQKFAWVLDRTEEVLAGTLGVGAVAAVLVDSDLEFSAAMRESLTVALDPVRAQVAQDVADGALAPHADPDLLVDLVVGSYLAERLRHGRVRPQWRERVVPLLTAAFADAAPAASAPAASALSG